MKKYNVGIIGIGQIAYVHIEALKELYNVSIVSLCSRSNVEEKALKLGISKYTNDYKEMIDHHGVDAVHICTPNDTHLEIARYAMERGVHVILEKPMTKDFKEAYELYQLSLKYKVICKIHFHNRFYPIHQYVKAHMDSIGDIFLISGRYVQDWMGDPNKTNWRANQKSSGLTRAISDIGTHFFDLIEFVTNHQIVSVLASFKRVYDERAGEAIDTEDLGVVLFKTDKGAIGSCIISQVSIGHGNQLDYEINGKKGTIIHDGKSIFEASISKLNQEKESIKVDSIRQLKNEPPFKVLGFKDAFREAFRTFYHEIETNEPNDYATFKEGLHSMRIVDAIYESSIKESWININD